MSMEVTIVVAPQLKRANARVATYLKQKKHDGLFLPFPKGLEEFVAQFVEGLPFQYLISELKRSKIAPQPLRPWALSNEPLLKVLPQLKTANERLRLYCYGDPLYGNKYSIDIAVKISALTLATSITGEVNTGEWRKVFQKDLEFRTEAIRRETDFVTVNANRHEKSICVSDLNGRFMVSQLQEEGFDAVLKDLDPFYQHTPIEKLTAELTEGEISEKRLTELVLLHVRYVREYILTSNNLDEAYLRWLNDQNNHLSSQPPS